MINVKIEGTTVLVTNKFGQIARTEFFADYADAYKAMCLIQAMDTAHRDTTKVKYALIVRDNETGLLVRTMGVHATLEEAQVHRCLEERHMAIPGRYLDIDVVRS